MKKLSFLLTALVFGAFSTAAWGGEVNYLSGSGSWSSTECERPESYQFNTMEADTINYGVSEFIAQVQDYNRCLRAEADRDLRMIHRIINDDLMTRQNEMIDEVNQIRSKLLEQSR
ncbi:MAG: hypothetical protein O7A65_06405 [Proteobacteria bacterium]|nr:hypothetical protein [Pseudomonadota bacterium]